MNKREARKKALQIVAQLARERALMAEGNYDPSDAKRMKEALEHIAKHHEWEADGRPER